jgi:uncharacterized protein (DUF608 family)
MKVAGSGAAAVGMGSVLAGKASADGVKHLVPADKELDEAWLNDLYRRGEKRIWRGKELNTIGMPVCGIATGQLYLRGDGTLGIWQIFNKHHFTGVGEHAYEYREPDSPVDSGFAVAVRSGGSIDVRKLDRKGFEGVDFNGEYPIGTVGYRDTGFPVEVEMEAFSPFIPLNAKDSALPATVFHITVSNRSEENVRAGIIGWLENAVCFYSAESFHALRRSKTIKNRDQTILVHSAERNPTREEKPIRETVVLADFEGDDYGNWKVSGEAFGSGPASGTLPNQSEVTGFQGEGFVNTFLGGDKPQGMLISPAFTINRRFINFLVGGGNKPEALSVNLYVGGKILRKATGWNNEKLAWHSWAVGDYEGQTAQIEIVDRSSESWGHINVDQVELSDTRRTDSEKELEKLSDFGTMALAFFGRTSSAAKTRDVLDQSEDLGPRVEVVEDVAFPVTEKMNAGIMSRFVSLGPGERHTFAYVLAWHFPNHPHGHEYANRFEDATDVAGYVLDNLDRLATETREWHDTYYNSTLPYWFLDRIHSTVSNLATGTCQWWKNGRFWAWEGVGCCHGTCTHVWNYAHAHARLFPELPRSAREMQDFGAGFHPDTGLVGFRGGDAYAADGQCGTILKAYREHQMSPDAEFLERNWPKIKKALEYAIEQDGNADGLIENAQHNTYDIEFYGENTFVGSLYLAALRAGEEMAREAGDEEFAARVRRIFDEGSAASSEDLWNGEYFIQRVNLEEHPEFQYAEGCLSDHLFGEGWARQLHLGPLYPPEKVRSALSSIWRYNWAPDVTAYNTAYPPWRWFVDKGEGGLFVCTWPKGRRLDKGVNYKDEVWTGIEYQVAGHLVWEGLVTEGLSIVKAVEDRYHPTKRNPWNEVECGDHYARALASWGVLTALAGYEYHGPKGYLAFAPRVTPEQFRCAFTAAEGWGSFHQERSRFHQRDDIEVQWGRIRLRTLEFEIPDDKGKSRVSVRLGDREITARTGVHEGRVKVEFSDPLTVGKSEILEVEILF